MWVLLMKKRHFSGVGGGGNLFEYQINMLDNAAKTLSFKDKIVLEVGGSNLPKECVFDILGASKWVCIDLIEGYQIWQNKAHYAETVFVDIIDENLLSIIDENKYVIIKADIADIGIKLRGLFDVCFSCCSFEHIHRLNLALSNIYYSLNDEGVLYTEFGPVFSCKYGSHYWYDENSNFNHQEKVLDYKHLLMDNMELLTFLLNHFSQKKANMIHYHFKHSERINRFFLEDYKRLMEMSEFKDYIMEPCTVVKTDETTQKLLEDRYPGYKDFSTYSVRIVAHK